jgi:hypothetical protein
MQLEKGENLFKKYSDTIQKKFKNKFDLYKPDFIKNNFIQIFDEDD